MKRLNWISRKRLQQSPSSGKIWRSREKLKNKYTATIRYFAARRNLISCTKRIWNWSKWNSKELTRQFCLALNYSNLSFKLFGFSFCITLRGSARNWNANDFFFGCVLRQSRLSRSQLRCFLLLTQQVESEMCRELLNTFWPFARWW